MPSRRQVSAKLGIDFMRVFFNSLCIASRLHKNTAPAHPHPSVTLPTQSIARERYYEACRALHPHSQKEPCLRRRMQGIRFVPSSLADRARVSLLHRIELPSQVSKEAGNRGCELSVHQERNHHSSPAV
jgi:hypothetical protein